MTDGPIIPQPSPERDEIHTHRDLTWMLLIFLNLTIAVICLIYVKHSTTKATNMLTAQPTATEKAPPVITETLATLILFDLDRRMEETFAALKDEIDQAGLRGGGVDVEDLGKFIDRQEAADKALERARGTWTVLRLQLDAVRKTAWQAVPADSTNCGASR